MDRIPKTNDQVLNSLIKKVEHHTGTRVKQGPVNSYAEPPYLVHVALNHIEYTVAQVEARSGALTDDTLINPRVHDKIVNCTARVGTVKGQGVGYYQDSAPLKQRAHSLERRIDIIFDEAFAAAADNYDEFITASRKDASAIVPNIIKVEPQYSLKNLKEKQMPIDKLRRLARLCSKILSSRGDEDSVVIKVHEEERRFVNSEGTLIKDNFFGYEIYMGVTTRGGKPDSPAHFYQKMYFTDKDISKSEKTIAQFAKCMQHEVEIRKKCDPKISNGLYPAILYQGAMATQLHECFVHFLASDEILYTKSTTLGWENFGKMCTNPHITVYSNPGMEGKWGSMEFDHEGVPAKRKPLIKDGKVVGYLADRDGAYHLSRLTKEPILPGDARIGLLREDDSPCSQARISNLEVEYSGQNRTVSRRQMLEEFVKYLQKNGHKEGILIPDSSSAECFTEEGSIVAYPNFPYLISAEGKLTPTKFITTRSDVHTFLNNIVTMGGPREYIPHLCGVGDEESLSLVRAGILCGTGIVNNMHIHRERPEELRQPRFK